MRIWQLGTRIWVVLIVILSGCASIGLSDLDIEALFGKTVITDRRANLNSDVAQHYREDIEPVIEQRCVVCHACYDAPCQLKLTSPNGIMRGAINSRVYDGTRLFAAEPTRLDIDATTTEGWREKGFHPVVNERNRTSDVNLANSLLYQMIALKQNAPATNSPLLSDDIDVSLNREQSCPTSENFAQYAEDHPQWGMPYGLPALSEDEYTLLTEWISNGATMSQPDQIPGDLHAQISEWENYLNDDSLKQQLASRYIFEHLFLANLYFSPEALFKNITPTSPPKFYFKMVRSYTPPGLPIKIVPTRRPYGDPKTDRIYYRIKPVTETIVAKTHIPYRLNQERLAWMQSLFNEPDYEVTSLPSYDPKVAANAFVAFEAIPSVSRYRFMLEEAEFIIRGFIKGPVCRGQVALNVIEDHFWAFFVDPDVMDSDSLGEFLKEQSNNLRLPGEAESNSGVLTNWLRYSKLHGKYLDAKNERISTLFPTGNNLNTDLIWDGDGHNPNAALTITRHFDSSTVVKGLVGQPTKTAWVVDYTLLERIHYLLVAEFDVYGNVGHQLMTRLYMDFLRMEGEQNFLQLLPQEERVKLAHYWYRNASDEVEEYLINYERHVLSDPSINYQTDNKKLELYNLLAQRIGPAVSQKYNLAQAVPPHTLAYLTKLNDVTGRAATLMPEISYVTIENMNGQQSTYSLLRASAHANITGLLYEEDNRLPEEDYLTLVPGVMGTHPSALYRLSSFQLSEFTDAISSLNSENDYANFAKKFAVRRTDPNFWTHSDQIHKWFKKHDPLYFGILDYNRLENR
ncbi:MAG: 9-hexadecenoic acid cis-trans isomerase [Oceanobacter sp.]|nr:MAG: 9-hexadecenoic acid cis-trans isomerase [Oceanobacter sp.]